jgi:poly(A) polymerase
MNVTKKPHLHQDWIDPHAIGIVRALQKADFTTYLVGGCVRDLLLGNHPKDFDIATNAKPDEVKRIIHRAYVIGKRFRLVLVRRDEQQFEVATFRRDMREDENAEDLPSGDNIFGSPEDDAQRRDFTINALFYDPINDQLIDFAGGRPDLEAGWVRMIGDPMKRLIEDPIRIMRALRLKHMIDFRLDPALREAMGKCAHSLTTTALPRRREEILKWLRLKRPELAFREACDMGILEHLSPTLHKLMESESGDAFLSSLSQMRDFVPKDASPAELFAYLVHCFVRCSLQVDPVAVTRPRELAENEELHVWMRDELGMFKFEQALTVKALHVEPLLSRRREFQRKGERRQKALLSNEAFPMALGFAKRDYLLNCEDLLYWNQQYEALRRNGGGSVIGENSAKRRRRRRPRRGKPRSEGEAENVDTDAVSLESGGTE